MKTTIDVAAPLLAQAKQVAAIKGVTLSDLVEDGLRLVIEDSRRQEPFRLRRATFCGQGLQLAVVAGSWERLRDLANEGRG